MTQTKAQLIGNIVGNVVVNGNTSISGITTSSGGFVGNLTGTATTATLAQGLTGTPNLNVGVITATTYYGSGANLTGVSAGATVSNDSSTNTSFYPLFTTQTTGIVTATKISTSALTFNPSTGTLTATTFSGSLSGNASSATSATFITGTGYNGYGARTVSTGTPSGGSDGDIWYKY